MIRILHEKLLKKRYEPMPFVAIAVAVSLLLIPPEKFSSPNGTIVTP